MKEAAYEEFKDLRDETEDEILLESTESVADVPSGYDELLGTMADPSITTEMVENILKQLNLTETEFIAVFKKARKATEPPKTLPADERYSIALDHALNAMKISKRFMSKLNFDDISREEIKSTVQQYYSIQATRISLTNQVKASERAGKECKMLVYFAEQLRVAETNIKTYIDTFTDSHPVCVWMKSIMGIGPVIAAGLISYFDIKKTKTAGGFWAYVGWTGELTRRKKGEKFQYNPKARVLCWKAGHSFKMRYTDPNCYYGSLYSAKKEYYKKMNENNAYAATATEILANAKFKDGTNAKDAYLAGKLPDGHIDARASRFAVKVFLSHLFDVWYMYEYGEYPPVPFAKAQLGHVHIEAVPNFDLIKPYLEAKWPDQTWNVGKIYAR